MLAHPLYHVAAVKKRVRVPQCRDAVRTRMPAHSLRQQSRCTCLAPPLPLTLAHPWRWIVTQLTTRPRIRCPFQPLAVTFEGCNSSTPCGYIRGVPPAHFLWRRPRSTCLTLFLFFSSHPLRWVFTRLRRDLAFTAPLQPTVVTFEGCNSSTLCGYVRRFPRPPLVAAVKYSMPPHAPTWRQSRSACTPTQPCGGDQEAHAYPRTLTPSACRGCLRGIGR
jgi:hypothetical protein